MRIDLILGVEGTLTLAPASHQAPGGAPSTKGRVGLDAWDDICEVPVAGAPCIVSSTLIERLNFLSRTTSTYWLTSWAEFAPRTFAPAVGLHGRTWPVLHDRSEDQHRVNDLGWWKAAAVERHLARTPAGTVVWIDDDICDWAQDATGPRAAALLADERLVTVCPPASAGLTPGLLAAVEDLVEEAAARESA